MNTTRRKDVSIKEKLENEIERALTNRLQPMGDVIEENWMDERRLQRKLMYLQLKKEIRPLLRFKVAAERNMKARQIDTRRRKPLAQGQEEWRSSISARPKP
ncbi:hypothetical protein CHS0354_025987 [Potamilus streckersoni]|uniref:Uncharacterized protein n=1 Tax=Potamilus streckersoni TaxID=2493646 RepID=A0AAE0W6K9_9BIVA|nr:hypothetical protein CHS0354_025987 [Potamilus streckersoni]